MFCRFQILKKTIKDKQLWYLVYSLRYICLCNTRIYHYFLTHLIKKCVCWIIWFGIVLITRNEIVCSNVRFILVNIFGKRFFTYCGPISFILFHRCLHVIWISCFFLIFFGTFCAKFFLTQWKQTGWYLCYWPSDS